MVMPAIMFSTLGAAVVMGDEVSASASVAALRLRLGTQRRQPRHSQQVVCAGGEVGIQLRAFDANEAALAQTTHRLEPASISSMRFRLR